MTPQSSTALAAFSAILAAVGVLVLSPSAGFALLLLAVVCALVPLAFGSKAAPIVSLLLLGVIGTILWQGFRHAGGDGKIHPGALVRASDVSDTLFGPYGIPFEVASVLLLAALVGAVAIARRD